MASLSHDVTHARTHTLSKAALSCLSNFIAALTSVPDTQALFSNTTPWITCSRLPVTHTCTLRQWRASSCPFPDPISISSPAGFHWANAETQGRAGRSREPRLGLRLHMETDAVGITSPHETWEQLPCYSENNLSQILEAKNLTFSTKSQPFHPMSFPVFIFSCWRKERVWKHDCRWKNIEFLLSYCERKTHYHMERIYWAGLYL